MRRAVLGLAAWLAVTFAAAAVGAAASANAGTFYQQLVRPAWAPPGWVFGPVWTVLYVLMGVAAWIVWRPAGFRAAVVPLTLFLVQLAVNALWTWLFFIWKQGGWAFAEILVLWVLILATLVTFWRARPVAGILLVPYLGWVTFAAVLNFVTWRMNRPLLG